MVGEPKYVPAELYWLLNEVLRKTKNDVMIAGYRAVFGKDLNPTQIRYVKNKYGKDPDYNSPLVNKRLAYKFDKECEVLRPGYKRDQGFGQDLELTQAERILAANLLPYGAEACKCPQYPSTEYMRQLEQQGIPYRGPHLPPGSKTFGEALKAGAAAPKVATRESNDAGPSSSRPGRPASGHGTVKHVGTREAQMPRPRQEGHACARLDSPETPIQSIENTARTAPMAGRAPATSAAQHQTIPPELQESGVNQPVSARLLGQSVHPQRSAQGQRHPISRHGLGRYQPPTVGSPKAEQGQQPGQGTPAFTTQEQHHRPQAARDQQAGRAGTGQVEQPLDSELSIPAEVWAEVFGTQQQQDLSAFLTPLRFQGHLDFDGLINLSPPAPSPLQVPSTAQPQATARMSTARPPATHASVFTGTEGAVSTATGKRNISPTLGEASLKRARTELAQDQPSPAAQTPTTQRGQRQAPAAAHRDPATLHPPPTGRPTTSILDPATQDQPGSTPLVPATPASGRQPSSSEAAVNKYVNHIRFSISLEPEPRDTPALTSASTPTPAHAATSAFAPETGMEDEFESDDDDIDLENIDENGIIEPVTHASVPRDP